MTTPHNYDSDRDYQDAIHGPEFSETLEFEDYAREQEERLCREGECDHIDYEQWNAMLVRLMQEGDYPAHEVVSSLIVAANMKQAACDALLNDDWVAKVDAEAKRVRDMGEEE